MTTVVKTCECKHEQQIFMKIRANRFIQDAGFFLVFHGVDLKGERISEGTPDHELEPLLVETICRVSYSNWTTSGEITTIFHDNLEIKKNRTDFVEWWTL